MTIQLSSQQARLLLAHYHFTPTDLPGVITRLGTVQYDPLHPVGRNPDLVFQARVPGYQIDDWQALAYSEHKIYDAWDKQACLVATSDWPHRALTREHYRPYHDREILQTESEAVAAILAELDERGPLSSLELERKAMPDGNTWYGATQARRILRSLWASGEVVTHHRHGGRHYYDRPARVIPTEHFKQPSVNDLDAYHRWITARRFQAAGLLRPNASAEVWEACGNAAIRRKALNELLEAGTLTPVEVGEKHLLYYAYTEILTRLDQQALQPRMIFLGPLDSLLWDRKGTQHIFDFDYIWEVYKPEPKRKWGYYVLPVFYKDRFVARLDSRLAKGVWQITRWWWEQDIQPDEELLAMLYQACKQFLTYLGGLSIQTSEQVDSQVQQVIARLNNALVP